MPVLKGVDEVLVLYGDVPLVSPDTLKGLLGQAMEQMRVELQNFYLKLEHLVAERTRELALSEHKYRRIFEVSRDMILVTRWDGTIINMNPALCNPDQMQPFDWTPITVGAGTCPDFIVYHNLDMATRDRLRSGHGNALLVSDSIYAACRFFEMFPPTKRATVDKLEHHLRANGVDLKEHPMICGPTLTIDEQTEEIVSVDNEDSGPHLARARQLTRGTHRSPFQIPKDI